MDRRFIKLGLTNLIPLKTKIFLWILLLSLISCSLGAQPFYFRHYQVENGLSHNTVYCSFQDRKGFLWFGTKDGLNRFDGYTFKVFRHSSLSGSLGNNLVFSLYEDDQNRIWVGTDKGLYIFNVSEEVFYAVKVFDHIKVSSICADRRGNLWILGDGDLYRYSRRACTVTSYNGIQHFSASSLCMSPKGILWLATNKGMIEKFIPEELRFEESDVFSHSPKAASRELETIYTDNEDYLFIGTPFQGFKQFNTHNSTYKDLLTYNPDRTPLYVRSFLKTGKNEYWIATESGIYIFNAFSGQFTNLKKNNNDPYSLSDNAVYCLFKDKEGGIWAGTYYGGLNYYPRQYSLFKRYYPGAGGNSIRGNIVREIRKDSKGSIWIGTEDNGLNRLDPLKGVWTHYLPGSSSGLCNKNIHGLLPYKDELFIGTFRHGLDVMNTTTGKVIHHYLPDGKPGSLNSNFILSIHRTGSGAILLASDRGLYRYLPRNRSFCFLPLVPKADFIHSILEDHAGHIWLGTWNEGLFIMDQALSVCRNLSSGNSLLSPLKNTLITGLFEDSRDNIWICTDGMGLWKYRPADRSVKVYDISSGMPGNYAYKTLEDEKSNIWVSTSRGLVCLDPVTDQLKIYSGANGLLSDQFNYSSGFKDDDGTMYFGCVKGMISFKPATFSDNNYSAPVYITRFEVQNKELTAGNHSPLSQSVIYTHSIRLDPRSGSVNLDFAALNFAAPEMTRYKYKMEGLEKNWTLLKTNRRVYFTGMGPGTYLFRVKASANGKWTQEETDLSIQILAPWWQSTAAWFLYAGFSSMLVVLLFRIADKRTKLRQKQSQEAFENSKEKELYHAKIEFFTRITHEIRTPLTLIRGPMEKVLQKAGDMPDLQKNLLIMERNTNRLLELANQLLDFKKNVPGTCSLSFVKTDVNSLMKETFLNFNSLAQLRGISYTLHLPEEELFAWVDTDLIKKILNNIFSNAVKYCHKKVFIAVYRQREGDRFILEVKNDGHLIEEAFKEKIFEPYFRLRETESLPGSGIGLSLARSLAELHHGTLTLEKRENGLNTFCLNLPVHQSQEYTSCIH